MSRIVAVSVVIFAVAVLMAMTGRGGGNFYVPVLIGAGAPMHEAATTAQFVLASTAVAASLVFQKFKAVDWKLALVIDPPTDVMAFVGGYYAHRFAGDTLKLVFVVCSCWQASSCCDLRGNVPPEAGNGSGYGSAPSASTPTA